MRKTNSLSLSCVLAALGCLAVSQQSAAQDRTEQVVHATRNTNVVVPLYKSEANIPDLLAAIDGLAASLDRPLQAVFVDDGSPDQGYLALQQRLDSGRAWSWCIVRHARNFGAFEAIRTGLAHASGDYIAVMAADLQEPPAVVREFYRIMSAGRAQVVVGQRIARDDPGFQVPVCGDEVIGRRSVT